MWTIFCSIKRSWTQHFVTQFSAFLVMTLTFSAALFVGLAINNTESLLNWWGQVNKVTVYLKHGDNDQENKKFESFMKSHKLIQGYVKVDSKESSKRFKDRFAQIANQKIQMDKIDEFFPEFYEVKLNQGLAYHSHKNTLTSFVSQMKVKFPQIQDISFGQQWLQKYITILSSFKTIAWILIGLFVLASLIASSSVIKTLLFAKRDEIEVLEFIGASEYRIYVPQIANILLMSTFSFGVAVLINFIFYKQLSQPSLPFLQVPIGENIKFITFGMLALLFSVSFLSNFVYSVMTIFNLMPSRKKAMMVSEVFQR